MGVPQPTATVRWNHMAAQNVSKKRKFVADGVFYAELNELLVRELAEDGYSGVEVRQTPARHEIIIRATRTQNVLGEKGRRIRELTAVVQKRFNFPAGSVELYAEKVLNRGLCAVALVPCHGCCRPSGPDPHLRPQQGLRHLGEASVCERHRGCVGRVDHSWRHRLVAS